MKQLLDATVDLSVSASALETQLQNTRVERDAALDHLTLARNQLDELSNKFRLVLNEKKAKVRQLTLLTQA